MKRGTLLGVTAGVLAVLILAPPSAHTYVRVEAPLAPQTLDADAGSGSPSAAPAWDDDRALEPLNGRGPGMRPLNERVTKPVPEPGTITLASLGLLAIGAALRRRRGSETLDRSGLR